MIRLVILPTVLALGLFGVIRPAMAATGLWATEGYRARVRIAACPDTPETLCGTIVWLWNPLDGDGNRVRDSENPDPQRRGQPLIGTIILRNFRPAGPGVWRHGKIYNPEDGQTYSGTLKHIRPDLLEVSGCVFLFCRSQVWRSADSVCLASAPNKTADGR
jgi:uncharacterized protein (DUF2147 family)